MPRQIARVVALLLLLGLVAGCDGYEGQVLRVWTFHGVDRARTIVLPVHLNDSLPRELLVYRLSTEVAVAKELRGGDVDLVVPSLPSRIALRVDGTDVPLSDDLDPAAYRHVGPHRFRLPRAAVESGKTNLELAVTYSWTQAGWLDAPPRLIRSGTETPLMKRNRLLNDRGGWFGLIGLSQMGFMFLAVYFWDTRRRAYLWFAIQALSASYYPAYVLGWTAHLGSRFELLLLAQNLSIAPIISVYYAHALFERGTPSRVWPVLLAIALVVPLPAIFSTFVNSEYGTPGVVVCVAAAIAYQLFTGVRLMSTYGDRRIVLFFLCCWVALGGSAWVDLCAWLGRGEILGGARPACIGLGLFGMFQSMLLGRSHFRTLQEADRLNANLTGRLAELEHRQAEIEDLNEELRQQVGRRSATILAALTSSSAQAAPLEPGDIVEDRYRVIGALGSGGMGTVYEVERLHDGRRLALKVTLQNRGMDLARLAREAQVAARVRHPNVVSVVDTDVAKAGYVYVVMELVEGCSLAECEGRHDAEWCIGVLVQVLHGLIAIHAQGIIHRDLKPSNVLLSGDVERGPRARIVDFGISRMPADVAPRRVRVVKSATPEPATVRLRMKPERGPDATDPDIQLGKAHAGQSSASSTPQLTMTGAISGTPSYVAPELARTSGQITPAVDVFSFGVVAYRLFTGAQPHPEAPLLARLDGREPLPHLPLCEAYPELPEAVARIVDACLSAAPEKRPTTTELLGVLSAVIETRVRAPA
ncbi:MAG TPA: protein kinase [Polyangiaceae bacterium]|nr:protein kinase [Polyangiaceae bacterium]